MTFLEQADLIRQQKRTLRSRFLNTRIAMTEDAHSAKTRDILKKMQQLPELLDADTIHAYWPIEKKREIDLRPLIRTWYAQRKQVVLPYILDTQDSTDEVPRMHHRLFTGETNLKANRWDVYEPSGKVTVPVNDLDVVIVPALACARDGYRIGYGKGYYDAFLSQVTCPTVCLVFHDCLAAVLPHDHYDIPVDIVVTESSVYRTRSGRSGSS